MSTMSMTSRTMSMSLDTSRPTLAARSLAAVDRVTDPKLRFAAFDRHMQDFPPLIAS
ncbi:hypothetical protein RN51_01328 [Microbacterium oxydans]|uniref:Uncharacterized protein n=2 Tax=Microbacterium TaxID=33882 RepID=A0A0F0KSF6_9MICO|nr:hypothetical protein [Microbacterium oxydans]KJL23793.1 hypothetical protein RN51_01328 [Microbacterium oxydans]